ncbi:TPA: glycosyltransferase family 2 protein [Klebsiella quasipneumoniae]|uniref:glycosyltransferase family 2 protein n=2 Tax=Klebsiella quasipneumoniae TaxID=1463165 RepID=UPI00236CE2A8|nr:glycosyltransferase family 2 protein [Klebsiella quasipneumoniae subsp. similipneumoniae]HCM6422305.1 glycosyltransferase family 2 protein [Klebsiella quasipneumoniae]HDK6126067.1 glycosyltransferase family 2 protein [Klebsiella quasipneumoniae]
MDNIKVSAIIVTFNPELDVLSELISSLNSQVENVVIVDNCSKNILQIKELKEKKRFVLIEEPTNIGLAAAQNHGIKEAVNNSTHIVIFDQDSSITSSFIENQLKCEKLLLDRGEKVSAVGPKFCDKISGYEYPATLYHGPFIKNTKVNAQPVEATFIIASGSLIRISVLKEVGLMLDDFFIDFVDVEWCLRANSKGYKCFINPFETMQHSIGDLRVRIFGRMISLHSDFRKFYIYRNGMFMIRLNYVPLGYKVRVLIFNMIRTLLGLCLSDAKKNTLKVSTTGWLSGFKKFNNKYTF